MSTKRAYELLVRFGENESVAGAHVKEMHLDDQGKDLRETAPIPLADAENPTFKAFADKFAAKAVAENEVLKSANATLTTEKATLESEKATLVNQLSSKSEQVNALTEEKATLTEALTAANARIASLLSGMPWNPRVMEASSFIARISSQELLLLASSTDPMLQQIIGMLNQWKENDWPIVLDSPEIQQAVGYLAQQGIVAQSRIAEVLRDCTREESYVADE
jgi:hypothetical protein